ncbi:chemotaxis protein CheW [Treponema sp. R80B11-R83G3]
MSDYTDSEELVQESAETVNSEKFLVFSILGKLYSFPSRLIGEIALFDKVFPLPLMPSYVLGVVNRYSAPYALFDIGLLFQKTPSPRNKIIILKEEIDRIAFLIDDVAGIADIQNEELLIVERNSDSGDLTDLICASFKWENGDVFVLDANSIMSRVSKEIA